MKTKITIILLLASLLVTSKSISQSKYGSITYNKAINISGKQRMLSQKMSKAYLLLSKGVNNDEIKRELSSSKFIFEKQLEILTENASSTAVKLSIKGVKKLWNQFKPLIESTPNYINSKDIIRLNTTLLKACHELVLSIEVSSNYNNQFFKNKNQDLVNIINISGKQRMLSQRLCLYYTANTMFPNNSTEYKKIMTDVINEFDSVIGNLLISSYNSTEIEEELGSVMSLWEKLNTNKRGVMNGTFSIEEVFGITNNLTKSFNKITGQYETIANN
ncbi:type IV pili methyl-accepting chemotaxis transducer N-terminal domain-containing protein [Aquimarina pacifica]|uniref:type IV pili methyl-accepting chemotaxis transducer N-terminal domain-containing protein n=1 Tax=Aquimarina pacifica TaxID=1296415 RepID=UPI00046F3987|nr:type IV pili methyl-accepting chemotaxis transducer N-terminal domain-containing protein [Aquimarina pacifica]